MTLPDDINPADLLAQALGENGISGDEIPGFLFAAYLDAEEADQ